jgi:hypothetical protein
MIIIQKSKKLKEQNLVKKTWILQRRVVRLNQLKNNNMAYERQIDEHLERLDQSLARLHTLIKRGENEAASRFMLEGDLKDKFEELRNIINVSRTGNYGARGVQNTRPL